MLFDIYLIVTSLKNTATAQHLSSNDTIRCALRNLKVNVTILLQLSIRAQALEPRAHILLESLEVLLLAKVNGLLVLAHLANLGAGCDVSDAEVVVIHHHLDGASDTAGEDIFAQTRFLAEGTRKADAVNSLEGVGHGAGGLEAAGHVDLSLAEDRADGVRELEEERFASLGGLALVAEPKSLVSAAGELDEVELVGFEDGSELLGFFGLEALFLELDGVHLDAEDEAGAGAAADFLGDFDD